MCSLNYRWPYNTYSTGTTSLPAGRPFSDAFHVYSLEWERSEVGGGWAGQA